MTIDHTAWNILRKNAFFKGRSFRNRINTQFLTTIVPERRHSDFSDISPRMQWATVPILRVTCSSRRIVIWSNERREGIQQLANRIGNKDEEEVYVNTVVLYCCVIIVALGNKAPISIQCKGTVVETRA